MKDKNSFKNLEQGLDRGVVLLNFSTPWCAPCSLQEPIITRIRNRFKQRARVLSLNIDEMQEVATELGIHSVPTIVILKQGKEIERLIGLQEEQVLANALERVMGVKQRKSGSWELQKRKEEESEKDV